MSQPPEQISQFRRIVTSYPARLLLGVLLIVPAGLVMAAVNDAPSRSIGSSTPTAAQPTLRAGQIGSGVWRVGSDVQPGTYRSTGATPERGREGYCMWSRHSTASGGPFDGIIASDGAYGSGQMIVTIEPGDVLFRTKGCEPFTKVG